MQRSIPEDRKKWWLNAYAYASFRLSHSSCKQLLKYVDSTEHELYLPLSTAIYVFYGRPFKYQRGIGKLDESFIPDRFMGIHKFLITFRDKVIVHTDAETVAEAGNSLLDLVYHVYPSVKSYSTRDPRPSLDTFKEIEKYLPVIIDKMHGEVEKIHGKFEDLLPESEGDHLFNLGGDVLFTPYKPPPNRITF